MARVLCFSVLLKWDDQSTIQFIEQLFNAWLNGNGRGEKLKMVYSIRKMRAKRASFIGGVPVVDPSVSPRHKSFNRNFCEWKTEKRLEIEDFGQRRPKFVLFYDKIRSNIFVEPNNFCTHPSHMSSQLCTIIRKKITNGKGCRTGMHKRT